jgi:hypothetical protein
VHQIVRNGTSHIIARYPNCWTPTRLSRRGWAHQKTFGGSVCPAREGGCVSLACRGAPLLSPNRKTIRSSCIIFSSSRSALRKSDTRIVRSFTGFSYDPRPENKEYCPCERVLLLNLLLDTRNPVPDWYQQAKSVSNPSLSRYT